MFCNDFNYDATRTININNTGFSSLILKRIKMHKQIV